MAGWPFVLWGRSSQEYASSFNTNRRQCPICRGSDQLDGSLVSYLTHLAVEHEQVMKYVQAEIGESVCGEFSPIFFLSFIISKFHLKL